MNSTSRLQAAKNIALILKYIESNLPEKLDNDLIKDAGFFSCAQMYRSFYSVTGHTVKEYVRKRRLSDALALVKFSDMTFTEAALMCGYSSHQSFCREVKKTLGITPSEYKNNESYFFFPAANMETPSEFQLQEDNPRSKWPAYGAMDKASTDFINRAGSPRSGTPLTPFQCEPLFPVSVTGETIPDFLRVNFYKPNPANIETEATEAFFKAFPYYSGRIFGRNGEQKNGSHRYELYLSETEIDRGGLFYAGFTEACIVPGFASFF
ncbi:MAG: AraC family transcriptional regulator, partial [Defluviitaleaceae bacterium]|nr:AraC family transcriptional regulator [Defluviitaleaceae bacterium]